MSNLEASTTVAERRGLWPAVRESLAGSHRDYTEGPIGRAILLLAIPMVLELALESVFAVVDVFFVSRLGADAVATVGLTESMLIIIYAVAMGLSVGAMAIVARRVGEKDRDGAARAAVQAIALGVFVAVPIGICGATLARPLLRAMGATSGVVANGSYTKVMLGANGVIMMLFLINAVFRGAGDAAMAMRVLWLANAINICLDPCLIFGLGPFHRLGVTGAAVATTTGRGVGVVVQLSWLARQEGRIAISRTHLELDPPVMFTMMRLSGSAVFQGLISNTSWVALVRILATFGSAALAGYTIALRVVLFALLPAWGTGQRRCHARGTEPGSRQARPRCLVRLARQLLQHAVSRGRQRGLRRVPGTAGRHLHERPRSRDHCRPRLADDQQRLRVLRVRHGLDAVVQRRGRHADPDRDQRAVLLAVRDPDRLRAIARRRPGAVRSVLVDCHRLFADGVDQCPALQARTLEVKSV